MTNKQKNLKRRDADIIKRLNELYHAQRFRWDDCVKQVAEEFYMEISTIETVLRKSKNKK